MLWTLFSGSHRSGDFNPLTWQSRSLFAGLTRRRDRNLYRRRPGGCRLEAGGTEAPVGVLKQYVEEADGAQRIGRAAPLLRRGAAKWRGSPLLRGVSAGGGRGVVRATPMQ